MCALFREGKRNKCKSGILLKDTFADIRRLRPLSILLWQHSVHTRQDVQLFFCLRPVFCQTFFCSFFSPFLWIVLALPYPKKNITSFSHFSHNYESRLISPAHKNRLSKNAILTYYRAKVGTRSRDFVFARFIMKFPVLGPSTMCPGFMFNHLDNKMKV